MLGFLQERHRLKAISIEVCFVFSVTTRPPVGERIRLVLFWYLIIINKTHGKNKKQINKTVYHSNNIACVAKA